MSACCRYGLCRRAYIDLAGALVLERKLAGAAQEVMRAADNLDCSVFVPLALGPGRLVCLFGNLCRIEGNLDRGALAWI